MELLLAIVEASAAAKTLASVSAGCLHAVEDCATLTETCGKALPAALSVLTSADVNAIGVSEESALECVRGLTTTMGQLQTALLALREHEGEGVLGVLLEHPTAWLEAYRGFRGLTAQLMALCHLLRSASQRSREEDRHAEEALSACLRSLSATCARARGAAALVGTDLPEVARSAGAAGWAPGWVAHCCATRAGHGRCSGGSAGGRGAGGGGAGGGGAGCPRGCCGCCLGGAACLGSGPASLLATPLARPSPPPSARRDGGGLLRFIGIGGGKPSAASPSTASPPSSPDACSPPSTSSSSFSGVVPGSNPGRGAPGRALEDAVIALVHRIQDSILYDSELEHLEQDRTYLVHRLEGLRQFVSNEHAQRLKEDDVGCGESPVLSGAASAAAGTAVAVVSMIQSEIMLAAVEARIDVVSAADSFDSGRQWISAAAPPSCGCRQAGGCAAAGGVKLVADSSVRGGGAEVKLAPGACGGGSRRQRRGMRWLPTCFVGA
ncbi:hypothetical protein GPECTOR_27g702 [Gonium pectorale]|uniref:Uncharacterized protein n=1 Tax=Gonium pectorale TaxID=33097 RepID=A0A150GF97_GONPE|nr:hypothetical protein GPECTOR_27g702 [Gonium pectorale]|eukprot:KXZ48531.1 hypothetical protein GPECTOR_27g702 [Gonium pectorale]